jgi:hypothetical protein
MNLKRTIPILMVGALAIAAALGIVAYRSVQASPALNTSNTSGVRITAHMGFGRGFGGGFDNEDLANALGISTDELNAAYQEATQAALEQAVEAGLITQTQADQLLEKGLAFPFGGRWAGWLSQNGIDFDALLAGALGITVDELQEAYTEANFARIDQAVEEGNLTEEQADLMKGRYSLSISENFRSAMRAAFESAVQQAVEEGVITPSQADRILENENSLGFTGLRGPGIWGGGHGFGRHRGPEGWFPGSPDTTAPSETPANDL